MKKMLLSILMIVLLFALCACGGGGDEQDVAVNAGDASQTVESGAQQEQNNDAANSGSDADVETESTLWATYYYVDDFNMPTEDGYICNSTYFLGTFSNSATTDSTLFAEIVVDEVDVALFLYEYGTYLVKNSSSYNEDYYNIKMRTADGEEYSFSGIMYCGDDRIFIDTDYIPVVIDALSQEGNAIIYFYVENADRTTTNYLFSAISGNFAKQYDELMQ